MHDATSSGQYSPRSGGARASSAAPKREFEGVAKAASAGSIELKDQVLHVTGDLAYELGVERGHITIGGEKVTIEQRVTNVYERIAGAWKLVHHHSDLSTAMVDVVKRLQKK